jgi:outer membrane protein
VLPVAAQHLTADEAVRIALENNHGVRIARNAAEIAKLGNTPGAAGMLPSLDANGAYSVDNAATKQEFFSGENRDADNANAKSLSGDVELNWTLFDGLSMFAAKDRLAALERIGESQLRQELEGTTYDVLTAYYQLVQLEKAVLVQREAMQTSHGTLDDHGDRRSVLVHHPVWNWCKHDWTSARTAHKCSRFFNRPPWRAPR